MPNNPGVARSPMGAAVDYRPPAVRTPAPLHPRTAPLHPDPGLLAYALRNEDVGSLRRLVLERLYERLTPAEKRLCDAERSRTAGFLQPPS